MHSYEEYKSLIESKLTSFIPDVSPYANVIKESMEYSLKVGGKRLRPVLLLAACEFAGGSIENAMPYACAVEYIHTYSLVHDDLPAMDNDILRRGQPTNHVVYGEDMAILAGDSLLNTAAELLFSEVVSHINSDNYSGYVLAGYEILKRSGINGMIAGQVVDVINENTKGTKELVNYIEEHKTADLITAPIIAGLLIAGADETTINSFREYGLNLGIAFQILDDILDIEGDQALLGKTLGKDIEQDKCNYVCVHGLDEAKRELNNLTLKAIEALKEYPDANFFIDLAHSLEKRNS